jgi:sulfite exporter TauE/SafE
MLVEEELKKLPSVFYTGISYKKSVAEIHSHNEVPNDLIYKAVAEAGYSVGKNDKKAWISRDSKQYEDLFSAFIVLVALYLLLKFFGITDLKINPGAPSNLFVVLLIGLTAGISSCMALVGGLILGMSARHAEKHPEATPVQKFRPHIFFNLGRIASYVILGGIIGLIGKAFQLSGPTLGILTLVVGIIMLTLGLQLIEIFPKISGISFSLPSGISKALGIKKHHTKEYSHTNSALVGALTFFLPCGFTQAMQIYAMSTGSFIAGALIMGMFAIGTAPGLLGIGGLTSIIKGSFSKKFFKFIGLVVIAFSLFNISNSLNLFGIRLSLPSFQTEESNSSNNSGSNTVSQDPNVTLENGVQVVRMTEESYGYRPNKFTIKKGIPVKWIIDAQNVYSCAASIIVPKLNIGKTLKSGENVFEFTPTETGTINFSCAMGMYTGKFTVIDDSNQREIPVENRDTSPTSTPEPVKPVSDALPPGAQLIKTVYTQENDIDPYQFKVKVDKPVRFEIDAKSDGYGCMARITIPGLTDDIKLIKKGVPIKFDFTPVKKGAYYITCAMGTPRGEIVVE